MTVRRRIYETGGVYFITLTCARWLPLFELTQGYDTVYQWFDYLKKKGNCIVAYVIMKNHLHVMIAFKYGSNINLMVGNGKRFMAYSLVKKLQQKDCLDILHQLQKWGNPKQLLQGKRHEVFEPSFDKKECRTTNFMAAKVSYIHNNPCKARLVSKPEDYLHSSADYYFTGIQGFYPVVTYMELQDVDLGGYVKISK